ncbi:MAG: DUF4266 domain-containing protein [Gammaproteobacteria bacterium]|nr:DUF4266 domain-containing protein [Pseudomonadota bacterium]MCZ6536739.1 DUF4266 domain-containing protein [Gammaproteobacteria bacterium]MCH8958015.1 DUF4266 domain-containing protein [Pseudomonadota bacterium]MCZ6687162.1 DUF4266 domain-containing protein [Gammaproteobacteria bacterium]MCZ6761622.1 DUF4266 domain-containing protein [Gammaproteobacteria bacterium]
MRKLTLLLIVFLLGACAGKPWVRPYEREALADPLMSFNQDPLADSARTHVFEVREGARGAGQSHGGGCGCN